MTDFEITIVDQVDDVLVADVKALLPQLSSAEVSRETIERCATAPEITLYAAVQDGHVVGLTTLVLLPQLTGVRGHIEDVVVDEGHRGQGIARALLSTAIDRARVLGARTLDLTSRPNRQNAHRLYEGLGFVTRDTDVMRLVP